MIVVRITSGLGNQMFQYALAKSLEINLSTQVKLDNSYFQSQNPNRNYELSNFDISLPIANLEEITFKKTKNIFLPNYKQNYVAEKSVRFDKKIFKIKQNAYLEGYWQSEKYFENIVQQLKKDFSFTKFSSQTNQEIIHQIQHTKNSVAVHFRRGDYAHHHIIKEKIGTIPLIYYHNAIQKINSLIGDIHLFIFSDEISWVKDNFNPPIPHTFITANSPTNGYDDLVLMAHCQHQIIANSTLSWWAAWLNTNPDKIIIAPKCWFKSNLLDSKDILPKNWITL